MITTTCWIGVGAVAIACVAGRGKFNPRRNSSTRPISFLVPRKPVQLYIFLQNVIKAFMIAKNCTETLKNLRIYSLHVTLDREPQQTPVTARLVLLHTE